MDNVTSNRPDIAMIGFGIIVLLLVALVLGVSTLASHRRLSWKGSLTQGLGGLLWASPVIAVLAFVAVRIIPYFQFGTASHHASSGTPSWLENELGGRVDVEEVPSFSKSFAKPWTGTKSTLGDEDEPNGNVSIDRETSSKDDKDELPEWTSHKVQRLASRNAQQEQWRIVLESDWEVSRAEAEAKLSQQAAELVQEDLQRFYSGGSALPAEKVRSAAVCAETVTKRVFNEGSNPFTMYKAYWQVELSPKVRRQVSDTWKQEISARRAWLMGGVLGLFTLMAGAFAAYFHLDEKSNGAHRTRLKLAATALMTAGGLGVLAALPLLV